MNKQESPTDNVVLVTSDFGLTLLAKASRLGIDTLQMPENYRIADKPDPNEIKVQQLEQKLQELNSRVPKPILTYEDGSQHSVFKLPQPIVLDQSEVEKTLAELKNKFPLRDTKDSKSDLEHADYSPERMAKFANAMMETVSQEEIERYNSEAENYIPAYENFLKRKVNFDNLKRRTISLEIVLANNGSSPAEDIDIYMHFPDGFTIIEEDNLPNPPSPPTSPVQPMTDMQKLANSLNNSSYMSRIPYLGSLDGDLAIGPPANVSSPDIKQTNSYDVHIHVQKIKHNLQVSLDPLFIVFDSYESSNSFAIEYKILAANIPHEITGSVHVIIEKDV
ncbi:MAG: hypothetical protein H6657_15270 [Ardenticatenaceae bacterium]|nr:hypothetical protein [Ardenticatenaceae bacterium]